MQVKLLIMGCIACGVMNSAYAIDAKYRQQLEHSGCTQVTELQGCDIRKSKEENAKKDSPVQQHHSSLSHHDINQNLWIAQANDGTEVAVIKIDQQQRIWVNDNRVVAMHEQGKLIFQFRKVTYTIFTDLEKQQQSFWYDSKSKTKGKLILR